jgi:hypothetical protein
MARRPARTTPPPLPAATPAVPPAPGNTVKHLVHTLGRDARDLLTAAPSATPKASLARTLADLEEFYVSTAQRDQLARAGRVRRFFLRAKWLLVGLFLKLTPARRVLLAIALVSMLGFRYQQQAGGLDVSIDFSAFTIVILLFVLALELKDKLMARDELEAGRAVQLALMPARAPVIPGWDIWTYTQSANDVGGDLVDYVPIDASRTALVLADVAGKGLSAALVTAKLQATLRALVTECGSLARLGACVNQIMYRDGVRSRFATLVWVEATAGEGRLRVLNAGHMAPLVVRGDALEELPRGGIALGMVPAAPYEEQGTDLAPGDVLVVYSDGVTEAMDPQRDFFGDERLRHLLVAQRGRSAEVIGTTIVSAVSTFAAGMPANDDVSLLVLRRTS